MSKRVRVYVAGPMTGYPDLNFPAFDSACANLRAAGYDVVSPHEVCSDKSTPYLQAMRRDVVALLTCEAICMLPGWQQSKGAKFERGVAAFFEFDVVTL